MKTRLYQKELEGRKEIKYIFFFKPGVQNVRYRSLFVNNLSKKFIAKKLYNLSSTLVSCIVIYSNFQITEKYVLKLKIKGVSTILLCTISGKAFLVLKIFLGRHTPKTIFLAVQNCFGLASKVPLPLQILRHAFEPQA